MMQHIASHEDSRPATATPLSPEDRIARFAADFRPLDLNDAHVRAVARTLLDTHAVAVAGRSEPASLRILGYLQASGSLHVLSGRTASLWGGQAQTLPELAALANGVAAHVLDYDDVSSAMRGHPSAALWPALLALGEARDVKGVRLVSAFLVGFELIAKLSRSMAQAHYARGWHSTPSIGTLAGAVACCHLLGLEAAGIRHAIGIAVAQTAGTHQNFGSDTKSFQAGHCNGAAVRTALLAEAGLTAGDKVLHGSGGFLDLYGGSSQELDVQLAQLGCAPLELLSSGVEVKKYPMCYAAHRALDGILDLRAHDGLRLSDVATIEVTSSRGGLTPLIHHRPATGLEAKFSMEYGVLAALEDGGVDFRSFGDEAVKRPALQAMLDKVVTFEEGDSLFPRWTALTLTLRDGRSFKKRIDSLRGSAQSPLSDEQLLAKADDCYRRGNTDVKADTVFNAACDLPRMTAREFMQSIRIG